MSPGGFEGDVVSGGTTKKRSAVCPATGETHVYVHCARYGELLEFHSLDFPFPSIMFRLDFAKYVPIYYLLIPLFHKLKY